MVTKILKDNKNTLFLYISQIIEKFLFLILVIFISRYFGAAGLGSYASSFAIVGVFFIFVNGGFDSLLIREMAIEKNKIKKHLLDLIILKACIGLFIFLIILYLSNRIRLFHDIKQLILILAFSDLIGSLSQISYCALIAYEKMKYVMAIFIISHVTIVGLAIISIISGGTLLHVISCFLIGSLVTFIFGIASICKLKFDFELKLNFLSMFVFIKKNIPFALASIFIFILSRIDIILLKMIKGNDVAGLYKVGYSFLMNFEGFPMFFIIALYPRFSRLFKRSKPSLVKLYKKSFYHLLLLNIFILVPIFVFGNILILLTFGNRFTESVIILRYAAIAIFFLFQNLSNVYFLNAINKPALNAFVFGLGILLGIVFDLLLIPNYSYYGVLIANIVTYSFIFITSLFIVEKEMSKLTIRSSEITNTPGKLVKKLRSVHFSFY